MNTIWPTDGEEKIWSERRMKKVVTILAALMPVGCAPDDAPPDNPCLAAADSAAEQCSDDCRAEFSRAHQIVLNRRVVDRNKYGSRHRAVASIDAAQRRKNACDKQCDENLTQSKTACNAAGVNTS